MKRFVFLLFFVFFKVHAQSPWPSQAWSSAVNLTNAMNVNGILELSGLHWNSQNSRLYAVQNNGKLRVLQFNEATNTFTQIGNKSLDGGPEGITQINLDSNELYVMDENNYQIVKYTYTTNFSSVTLSNHWDVTLAPSTMLNTGNTGPEGIVFVPDSFLLSIGFISQLTGQLYTSVKGSGGLFFIAHQDEGYVWVFDINPNINDDFAYVGKYKTNADESCDLAFDRSTGLLYILHNSIRNNSLEVVNLSSAMVSGERKFTTVSEYLITNPAENENIEGFAISPKCPNSNTTSVWLCRDVNDSESMAVQQDVLRWFTPFTSDGSCVSLSNSGFGGLTTQIKVFPNPSHTQLAIAMEEEIYDGIIKVINSAGQIVIKREHNTGKTFSLDVSALTKGVYTIEVNESTKYPSEKWIKN